MMKKILLPALLLAAFPAAAEEIAEDCTFGGVPLYGNVQAKAKSFWLQE